MLWTGAIGLMYASDYGYSTSATNSLCDVTVNVWNRSENYENCRNNSWLYNSSNSQWTISPFCNGESNVIWVSQSGIAMTSFADSYNPATPVLYLKTNVKITSGTGSSTDPYLLTQ